MSQALSRVLLGFLVVAAALPLCAGDSLFGTITEVRSAELVVLSNGEARFLVRLVGIEVPPERGNDTRARQFVEQLCLGKPVRMRLDGRRGGEFWARLLNGEPGTAGWHDLGLELVRNGLARKRPNYDYKYRELGAAENEARQNRRGIWGSTNEPTGTVRPN